MLKLIETIVYSYSKFVICALSEFGFTFIILLIQWIDYSIYATKSLVVAIKYVSVINLTADYL